MKQQILLRRFFASLLLLAVSTLSWAYNFEVDGIYYDIKGGNTVEVTNNGNNSYSGAVVIPSFVEYNEQNYAVTSIGGGAFCYCSGLTSVTIPNSVTSIGDYAFYDCSSLTSITIPNSVTSIGNSAFCYCSGLTSIYVDSNNMAYDSRNNCNAIIETSSNTLIFGCKNTVIPNSVTSIGDGAFSGSGLTSITIPESVTSIGGFAFHGCSGLTSVTIPESVTSIGDCAFENCWGLTSVTITEGVTSIGRSAFQNCGLTSITIPESVTSFGGTAFSFCSGLTSIYVDSNNMAYDSRNNCNAIIETSSNTLISGCKNTVIPNSVTSIGQDAFGGCSGLTSINIPESVTSIGGNAFADCSGLTSIYVDSNNMAYDSRNNCNAIIETSSNTLISGCKNTVIPNSVTSIGSCAFWGCSGLTSVTIPESVTSIGRYAFQNCSGLTSITCLAEEVPSTGEYVFGVPQSTATLYVPAGSVDAYKAAEQWKEFGQILPIEDGPTIIDFADANVKQLCVANWDTSGDGELDEDEAAAVTSLGEVFKDNTTITSFDELQYFTGLTSIGSDAWSAFYNCSGLTSVTIPNSVTSIGAGAFAVCSGLTSITIPESVTSIGSSAFWCSGLTSITIPNGVTSIGNDVFGACDLTSIVVEAGNTKYDSRNNCNAIIETSSNTLISGCKNTVIPNDVTSIATHAFENCSGLTSITIPNGVTSIGQYAFAYCSGLTSITIPESVTSIGYFAFEGCSGLTSVTIPTSVTSIGDGAFNGCSNLPVTDNLRYADTYLVEAVDKTKSAYNFKEGTRFIGTSAFSGCSGLTSITIPESVTSIGEKAFYNCSGLTSITIPNSVTSIGWSAFSGCSGLTSVSIGDRVTSIGQFAFDSCSGLTSVTCLAKEVPGMGIQVFTGVPQSTATLYVPAGSVDAYKAAEQWKEFGNIVGIDPTAVEELKSDKTIKANDNAPIYDLMGRRLQQKPASGYYIQGGKKYFVK